MDSVPLEVSGNGVDFSGHCILPRFLTSLLRLATQGLITLAGRRIFWKRNCFWTWTEATSSSNLSDIKSPLVTGDKGETPRCTRRFDDICGQEDSLFQLAKVV